MISAKEINRQAGRLQEQVQKYEKCSYNVKGELDRMQRFVQSEDSNFAKVLGEYRNAYQALETQIRRQFTDISKIMAQYAEKTTQNEQEVSQYVTKLSRKINDINSMIKALNIV